MAITVREPVADDAAILVSLVRQFKRQESEGTGVLTLNDLLAHGFGERARFGVLLAEDAGRAVGYALFHPSYDTEFAARGMYLQDLFVVPEARARGVGRALMAGWRAPARPTAAAICSGMRTRAIMPLARSTGGSAAARSRSSRSGCSPMRFADLRRREGRAQRPRPRPGASPTANSPRREAWPERTRVCLWPLLHGACDPGAGAGADCRRRPSLCRPSGAERVGTFSAFATLLGIAVTAIALVDILERRDTTVARMGVDSIAIAAVYLSGLVVLYQLR